MNRHWLAVVLALAGLAGSVATWAGDSEADKEALRAHLQREHPSLNVDALRATPLEGIYEVVSGTRVLYLSADGRYFLRGALIDLEAERDLTAERRNGLVHEAVDALGEERMLVYEPSDGAAQHTITVFTDTSCPYCQRLHRDLMELVDRHSVRVRYLLYPRAGVHSPAADTMRDVWCAPDPRVAMTAAKRGQEVAERDAACATPVEEHYALGRRIEVGGTPYLLLGEDGPTFSGYRPPEQLRALLGIDP